MPHAVLYSETMSLFSEVLPRDSILIGWGASTRHVQLAESNYIHFSTSTLHYFNVMGEIDSIKDLTGRIHFCRIANWLI